MKYMVCVDYSLIIEHNLDFVFEDISNKSLQNKQKYLHMVFQRISQQIETKNDTFEMSRSIIQRRENNILKLRKFFK